MDEERTKTTTHTLGFSSKAALLFEIIRVSMEVQEYGSIVRNDGNVIILAPSSWPPLQGL